MLAGLQSILEKQVVLATADPNDFLDRPAQVEGAYLKHVETFIPMGDTRQFVERLSNLVDAGKTPKGMIVAPYGYGKTSTLAFVWRECERRGLLAVPPFYCAEFSAILTACYGWVKYRLGQREPDLVTDLDALYHQYMDQTIDDMAARYAAEHGIARVDAVSLLSSMRSDGRLVVELRAGNLLAFLDSTTELIIRAGFRGLVVLADEFQQFISKSTHLRLTIQALRDFVWGLHNRETPLGVIFGMPTFTESTIVEQGQDILARLKNDNLTYRLQDIYGVGFPAQLWQRYTEAFKLGPVADQVIDKETLTAIGQIAERDDLGEGPRTVIDSFKRAILCHTDHGHAYTPINLADDFLESNISFEAHTNKLKTVTRQALESAAVDTPEKRQAIKLMAAFPRGCPVDVQRKYGLYDAVNALSKQGHGELMTHLIEGYTLLQLSRTDGPTHTVDIIIKKFWQSFEEDELRQEAAVRAFADHVLPGIFERRRGTAAVGWGKLDFRPNPKGTLSATIDGTFNAQYPHRLIALQVGKRGDGFEMPDPATIDIAFDFVLHPGGRDDPGSITLLSDRHIRLELNIGEHLRPPFPDDLTKLQQLVNPEFITPLLMLSLVDYFDRWESLEERAIPESDRQEINSYFIPRLISHSLQLLLSEETATTLTPPLRRVGRHMIEELFNRICRQLYPTYKSFYAEGQHEKLINDYLNAMRGMSLKERRGHADLQGTKSSLANRFGLTSVATFQNRLQTGYANLVEIIEFSGRADDSSATLRLKLHPLEEQILQQVRESSRQHIIDGQHFNALESNDVAALGRELGYREEETLLALQLLVARGYIRLDQKAKLVHLTHAGPDAQLLKAATARLGNDLQRAELLLSAKDGAAMRSGLNRLESRLPAVEHDEEELSELEANLHELRGLFMEHVEAASRASHGKMQTLQLNVERAAAELLKLMFLDREIQGTVAFVMHLNELRQTLGQRHKKLTAEFNTLKQATNQPSDGKATDPVDEALETASSLAKLEKRLIDLNDRRRELNEQATNLEHWIKLLRDTDLVYGSLSRLPDLRGELTKEIVPEIQAYLSKNGLVALPDWEQFRGKVEALEQTLETRQRHGNETFGQIKEQYEAFLRDIDVRDYRPGSRYTYGEDEGSYQDLYAEVLRKAGGRLDEIAQELEREQSDLLQAKYVNLSTPENTATISKAEQDLGNCLATLATLRKELTIDLIKAGGVELTAYGQKVKSVNDLARTAGQTLGPILFAEHELSAEERIAFETLRTQQDMDLTDLFVRLHKQEPTLTLGELLVRIETLYRKRRLTVRLRPRG